MCTCAADNVVDAIHDEAEHDEREEDAGKGAPPPVSYTHLTLPTIYSV